MTLEASMSCSSDDTNFYFTNAQERMTMLQSVVQNLPVAYPVIERARQLISEYWLVPKNTSKSENDRGMFTQKDYGGDRFETFKKL